MLKRRPILFASAGASALLAACMNIGACVQPPEEESLSTDDETAEDQSALSRPGVCITLQRGSPHGDVEDTYLTPGYPSYNYGDWDWLSGSASNVQPASVAGNAVLMRFTIKPGAIPAGANIYEAEVTVRGYDPGSLSSFSVKRNTTSWAETTVTAATQPAFDNTILRHVLDSGKSSMQFNLTQQVLDWLADPSSNHGIRIEADSLTSFAMAASENGVNKPSLKICYYVSPCQGKANGDACDDAGTCTVNGTCENNVCVAGQVAPAGTVCRRDVSACDVAELCDGVSKTCPTAAIADSGTACRASEGPCDVADVCDGASVVCPDNLLPASTICRAAAGPCDTAEYCTAKSKLCGLDVMRAAGTECRGSGGPCDPAESCTGSAAACPADGLATAGTQCRAANGACDVAESCTGSAAACPADGFQSAGVVCRADQGSCDVAESCTGAAATCPSDNSEPNGVSCGSGMACNEGSCAACGAPGQPCCAGTCNDWATCSLGSVCSACGTDGADCCPGTNACQFPLHCSTSLLKCVGQNIP